MYYRYEKDAEGIVTVTLDQPGRSANLMADEFKQALLELVQQLQQESGMTGVVVTSAKKTFMAGGDLDAIYALTSPQAAFDLVQELKAGLRGLETLGVPVVAAVNGSALGGGCELALACHHRVVLDDPKTRIGLPEVTLGLLPGAGGVTRLTRMLGIQGALPHLLEGRPLDPRTAHKVGIANELAADPASMLEQARAWIRAHPESQQPWDAKGFRVPGGGPWEKPAAEVVPFLQPMLTQKTRDNYPAPQAILNAVVEGAAVDFDTACRIESRYFAHLAVGQTSKNMIQAFWYQMNAVNGGSSRPGGPAPAPTRKVGILGAGMMGAGIAYSAAAAGVQVVLKDVSQELAEKGKGYSERLLDKKVAKGRMSEEKKAAFLERILATERTEDLAGCDLVIEAVFENRELKAKVTREVEPLLESDAVFSSNTSTLPITGLAEASARPENFVGLHFFSPVDKMPLVEIIVGEQTSDTTLAKAFDFVRQIRKTPIVVNDSRGFYTSRVFGTYVLEGLALLAEGQHPRAIESAGLQAGMPVGPLALTDEVSLGLLAHVREQTAKDLAAAGQEAEEHPGYRVVEEMVRNQDRLGKAAGKGFYEYPGNGGKFLWPGLAEVFPQSEQALPLEEMKQRLMFAQAVETARCVDEGVVRSAADANIGSILGWGFAPFKGGTLQYINDCGAAAFVARADAMAEAYGNRFAPPAGLRAKAVEGAEYL